MASIIRLCTASFVYYVGTNFVLQYSGSNTNEGILLPAWIFIAVVRVHFLHPSLIHRPSFLFLRQPLGLPY